jgi:TPR repeat protein
VALALPAAAWLAMVGVDQLPFVRNYQNDQRDWAQAAGRGLVEARFWFPRIYLEERSPLHDPRRGLDMLARAADQNHAHAALGLGQRLAAGDGVRRDPATARRYLQRAAAAGLPEATTELAKLR